MDFAEAPKIQSKDEQDLHNMLNIVSNLAREYNISEDEVFKLLLANSFDIKE